MKIPLHIVILNMAPSAAIEAEIHKRAEKLDQFSDSVMHCQVTVEELGKHKTKGRQYEVRIDLTVPGSEIAINRTHHDEDVYVVIRDAFDAAIRKLEDHVRYWRDDIKQHETALHGRVTKLFDEGYGFIETPDGAQFYFDRDNVVSPDFDRLEVGSEVQFIEGVGGDGLQAKRVSAGRHHLPDVPD